MKQIRDFSNKWGFKTYNNQIFGTFQGYQFIMFFNKEANTFFITTYISTSTNNDYLNEFLKQLKESNNISTYKINEGTLTLSIKKASKSITEEFIENLSQQITEKFKELQVRPSCFNCDKEGIQQYTNLNEIITPTCNQCFGDLEQSISNAVEEYQNKDNNYLMGAIGSFIGALIGSLLWIIIGMLGYIASIAGLIIATASLKGYTILKGKVKRLTPFIIGISSLIAIVLAQFISLNISVYREITALGINITMFDVISLISELLFTEKEMQSEFVRDLGFGLIFAIIGTFSLFRNLFRNGDGTTAAFIERV